MNTRFAQLQPGDYFYIPSPKGNKSNTAGVYLKVGTFRACRCNVSKEGILWEVYSQDIRSFTPWKRVTQFRPKPVGYLETCIVSVIDKRFGDLNIKAEDIVSKLEARARELGYIK